MRSRLFEIEVEIYASAGSTVGLDILKYLNSTQFIQI